jgi:proline dehydrogenase
MSIMLRTLLIYLSKASWARSIVTHWKFAWRAASRFVAGEKLEDAIRVVKALNAKGINATLDHLGEHTTSIEKAKQATEDILAIFDAIQESRVRSNVSIKLTQIGLAVDEEICEENLMRIAQKAKEYNTFLRIDMEDATVVDKTLALFRKARQTCGCENVGQAIQAYLYRSQADIEGLMKEQARIRLCKGAYKEPEDVAYPKKADVDASFDRLTVALVDGALAAGMPAISEDGRVPPIPAIATHDEKRIVFAKQCANERKLPKNAFEFQMLNGIRRDLQEELIAEGYPVRVYVPYGTEWYPYFVRRLAERPANIWFFLSNFFRK